MDRAFYGVSLNTSIILSTIGYSGGPTVYKQLLNLGVGNLIVVLAGAVPGYWVTAATVDTLGRKPIQLGGFIILTILFLVFGFAYNHLPNKGLLAIYVLIQFFFNFGPNATTFIVSNTSLCSTLGAYDTNSLTGAWRSLSNPLPILFTRFLCRVRENWCYYRPSCYCTYPRPWCCQGSYWPRRFSCE